jgi:hypothetical protein
MDGARADERLSFGAWHSRFSTVTRLRKSARTIQLHVKRLRRHVTISGEAPEASLLAMAAVAIFQKPTLKHWLKGT